jgi:hypothetical protein
MIRKEILDGKLELPEITGFEEKYGKEIYSKVNYMFQAMFRAYLKQGTKGTISLPYWIKKIENVKAVNSALIVLSKSGWVTSVSNPSRNWAEAYINESKLLEYVSREELAQVRLNNKFNAYVLTNTEKAVSNDKVRVAGKVMETGLIREGFRKAGNVEFELDTGTIAKYHDEVIALINKGIEKMSKKHSSIKEDLANYAITGEEVVESYIYAEGMTYTPGQNNIDWRGRNIK